MPPRANWKGYLRLSLVSCPIALYPASSLSEKVSFNRINRKTGNRLKQQNVDSETGEVVPREDIARGYEVGKGQYLVVEDEELEAVQIESTRTIDIDEFVPRKEIDDRYIDSPYYIAPDGQVGQDAFAVIRDTIGKMNMVALGRIVLTRREHVIALEPRGRVSNKSGHFDPSHFEDHYENALIDLLKKKEAGEKITPVRGAPPPQVVNLIDALRASIDAEKKKAPAPSTQVRRTAKKKASQK
jgi:DNA end-binding protein Ku